MSDRIHSSDDLKELVSRLSPARADAPREEWIRIGMAIHAADSSDFGYSLWEDFSRQSPKFDARDCRAAWKSFKPGSVTIATLIKYANDDSPSERRARPATSKRRYTSLAEYAEVHGAPLETFIATAWSPTVEHRRGRPALRFRTANGDRWRFLDGEKPPYDSPKGYSCCWYRLDEAITIAKRNHGPLVLCNGEASTVAAQHHDIAAFAVAGGSEKASLPNNLLDELCTRWQGEVLVALDCDAAGRKAAPPLAAQLVAAGFQARAVDLNGSTGYDLADHCRLHNGSSMAALRSLSELPSTVPATQAVFSTVRRPSDQIRDAFQHLGYTFRLNLCNDEIEINGQRVDDIIMARLHTEMRDVGFKNLAAIDDLIMTEAARDAYHPIRGYFTGLQWDGTDHIGELAKHLESSDVPISYPDGTSTPLHAVYLKRWLIGAVAKVVDQKQNLMLVIAGSQGIGKSELVRWLCRGLPSYFIEQPINVTDKDSDVRLMSHFLWEVSELDATTRRADVSALKAFITKRTVTVRKAYGRHDTIKPALASLFGTVNETTGFLTDESGNRRFLVTSITAIDWNYTTLDVDQIWAQAVALYHAGEPWRLQPCELARQQETNKAHEVESVLDGWIAKYFNIAADPDARMTAADIVDYLREMGVHLAGNERAQAMEISRVLRRLGVEKVRTNSWRGYRGVAPKSTLVTTLSDNVSSKAVTTARASQRQNDNVTTRDNQYSREDIVAEHTPPAPLSALDASNKPDIVKELVTGCQVVTDRGITHQKDIIGGDNHSPRLSWEDVTHQSDYLSADVRARQARDANFRAAALGDALAGNFRQALKRAEQIASGPLQRTTIKEILETEAASLSKNV